MEIAIDVKRINIVFFCFKPALHARQQMMVKVLATRNALKIIIPSLKLANWLSMNVKQRGKTKLQFPGFIDSRNSVFG